MEAHLVVYSVSVVQRTPALSGPPALTEIGPIHASGLSWGTELSRESQSTASTLVDNLDPDVKGAVAEQLDDDSDVTGLELWVRRDADLVHQGPIVGYQHQGDTLSFVSRGVLYYLRYMGVELASASFVSVDQYTIVTTLIDLWQDRGHGNFGLDTSNVGLSGTTRDRTYEVGDDVFQRVTELGEVNGGFDISVNVDRELVLEPEKGSDLSGSVVLDRRGITDSGLAVSLADDDLASYVVARGDGPSAFTAVQNTTLTETFGLAGTTVSVNSNNLTVLSNHATRALNTRDRALISPTPQLLPVAGAGVLDFDVGDVVAFDPSIGIPLNLARRVLRKSVSVDDGGNESLNIELS